MLQREILELQLFAIYRKRRAKSGLHVSDARLKAKARQKIAALVANAAVP